MKSILLLEHYYSPGELEAQIGRFVEFYNNQRYHESLENVTPADVYYGHSARILERRKRIKKETIKRRRNSYWRSVANQQTVT